MPSGVELHWKLGSLRARSALFRVLIVAVVTALGPTLVGAHTCDGTSEGWAECAAAIECGGDCKPHTHTCDNGGWNTVYEVTKACTHPTPQEMKKGESPADKKKRQFKENCEGARGNLNWHR